MKNRKVTEIIEFSVIAVFVVLAVWFIVSGMLSVSGWVHNWPHPQH